MVGSVRALFASGAKSQPISGDSIFGLATDHNGGSNVGSGAGGADEAQC